MQQIKNIVSIKKVLKGVVTEISATEGATS